MAIAGRHHGPFRGLEGVEGVQKLLLRGQFLGQEVDVVHEKSVGLAELLAKPGQLAQTHGLNEAIGEFLGAQEKDAGLGLQAAQTGIDAFEKMRLAGADGAMEDEGIGPLSRRLDDALGGGVGHAVARADDEVFQPPPFARQ